MASNRSQIKILKIFSFKYDISCHINKANSWACLIAGPFFDVKIQQKLDFTLLFYVTSRVLGDFKNMNYDGIVADPRYYAATKSNNIFKPS